MLINIQKFYSSNYRDFVHREALEDALKLVAEIYLKDTKVDRILNITFSVDEYGENPIYITYLDEEKQEHIVKLRPNITETLLERLKEYAKITYVDEQDEKLRQELTQVVEQSKQEAIDTSNNFTISHTNEVKNDILNIINQTSDNLKEYCDNKCEITLTATKNYTDAKADELIQLMNEEYTKITYVDEQDEKLRQELTQVVEQSKQEAIDTSNNFTISHTNEVKNDNLNIIKQASLDLKKYCDNKCELTLIASEDYTDAKADELIQLMNNLPESPEHTIEVYNEVLNDYGEYIYSISHEKVKNISFDGLVKNGSLESDNYIEVYCDEGTKQFNFLPEGINSQWFDLVNTIISNTGSNVSISYQDIPIQFYVSVSQDNSNKVVSDEVPCTLYITNIMVDNKVYRFYNTACTLNTNTSFATEVFDNNYTEYNVNITAKASNENLSLINDLGVENFPSMNIIVTASCTTQAGMTMQEVTTGTYNFSPVFGTYNNINFNLPHSSDGSNADIGVGNENITISLSGFGRMETEV